MNKSILTAAFYFLLQTFMQNNSDIFKLHVRSLMGRGIDLISLYHDPIVKTFIEEAEGIQSRLFPILQFSQAAQPLIKKKAYLKKMQNCI